MHTLRSYTRVLLSTLLITPLALFLIPRPAASARPDILVIHFIDVGQGSAVLIQRMGKNILYDCGDTGKGKTVWEYL